VSPRPAYFFAYPAGIPKRALGGAAGIDPLVFVPAAITNAFLKRKEVGK